MILGFINRVFISLLILSSVFLRSHAQQFLSNDSNFYTLKSVNFDSNNSDLLFLNGILADKRIVWLGEERHTDGTSLKAKSKIVKYLHENLGYEVILFEWNIYTTEKIRLIINEAKWADPLDAFALANNIDRISKSKIHLFNYIAKSNITFSGFDVIYHSPLDTHQFDDVKKVLLSIDEKLIDDDWERYRKLSRKNIEKFNNKEFEFYVEYSKLLVKIIRSSKFTFLARVQQNSLNNIDFISKVPFHTLTYEDFFEKTKLRDKYMAENLLWLLNEVYKNKKVIIWSSNFHMLRNVKTIKNYEKEALGFPMNEYIYPAFSKDLYCIALIDLGGKTGYNKGVDLPKPKNGSIESYVLSTNHNYSFIDFSQKKGISDWLNNENTLNVSFGEKYHKAIWPKLIDGALFIKNMQPDTLINKWVLIKMHLNELSSIPGIRY